MFVFVFRLFEMLEERTGRCGLPLRDPRAKSTPSKSYPRRGSLTTVATKRQERSPGYTVLIKRISLKFFLKKKKRLGLEFANSVRSGNSQKARSRILLFFNLSFFICVMIT